MGHIVHLIQHYGLFIVLLIVFLGQLGVPAPAYLLLIMTGALSHKGQYSPIAVLGAAMAATLVADLIWFSCGRKYGHKLMGKLCKISLSPDSCVKRTESFYTRFGPFALLFCKFIPGLASISSSLAGAARTRRLLFLLFDSLGAAIWAGSAILLGWLFSAQIGRLLEVLEAMGLWGGVAVVLVIAGVVASKWWKRRRLLKALEMARISVHELKAMLESGEKPTVIDTRAPHRAAAGKIPGAICVTMETIEDALAGLDPHQEIVLYCSCPNEATAAQMAKAFMDRGYAKVRPLAGGIDAWTAAGYALETDAAPAHPKKVA